MRNTEYSHNIGYHLKLLDDYQYRKLDACTSVIGVEETFLCYSYYIVFKKLKPYPKKPLRRVKVLKASGGSDSMGRSEGHQIGSLDINVENDWKSLKYFLLQKRGEPGLTALSKYCEISKEIRGLVHS
eukprot:Pgem_evm1s19682